MSSYPVQLDTTSPARFDRTQLLLRILISIILGWIGFTAGALSCLLYFLLPAVAAVMISTHGTQAYTRDDSSRLWRALSWLLAFNAYMMLLIDRFPVGDGDVRVLLRPTGKPSMGTALARLVMSIPSMFVLGFLGCISCILFLVSIVTVLVGTTVPEGILTYQRRFLRWQARLLAYHASLVEEYPPFTMAREEHPPTTPFGEGTVTA